MSYVVVLDLHLLTFLSELSVNFLVNVEMFNGLHGINFRNSGLVFISTKTFSKTTSQHNRILQTRLCFAQYVSIEAKQYFSQPNIYPSTVIFKKTIKPALYPSPINEGQKGLRKNRGRLQVISTSL